MPPATVTISLKRQTLGDPNPLLKFGNLINLLFIQSNDSH